MKKKIRIAIVYNDKNNLWQKKIISEIKNLNCCQLTHVIKAPKKKETDSLIFNFFVKLDKYIFTRLQRNARSLKVTTSELFKDIPELCINNFSTNTFKGYELDLVLNLTDDKLPKHFLNISVYGIWFFSHCDLDKINKRPYIIWEMLSKQPEIVSTLRMLKKNEVYVNTIDQTSICLDKISYSRNLINIKNQTIPLIIDNLKLLSSNELLFQEKIRTKSKIFPLKSATLPYNPPSNLNILYYVIKLYTKKLFQTLNDFFYFYQWTIIFNSDESEIYNYKKYKQIKTSKDKFWADPFLIKHNNRYYIFFEELIYKRKLGHISVMEIDKHGKHTQPIKILEKDYHLSYPFVFLDNGTYFMIPESSGNKDIQLYECIKFPYEWKFKKTLMTGVSAVDTTIYKDGDTYWMFTNMKKHEENSKNIQLHLFSSTSLFSNQWTPHPLNPIINDVKNSRPAGKIFKDNDLIIRPSQNCSNHYGYGLNLSQINELNESAYAETVIKSITPNWDPNIISTHTTNKVDHLDVSDIKIKRSKFF
ncbi:glucosamine inositolphosphorylceramide transferase family protein [Formosa sp. A9]|uniref:glucosamine inositolphosphorylceramide transferase family protein n=1 Tax=Formosa sp. A9 TaxID=3442641 RepID=UPI003EC1069A